jgi:hypothetical protein
MSKRNPAVQSPPTEMPKKPLTIYFRFRAEKMKQYDG